MGLTKVVLEITNPADPLKKIKGEFLVDSGSFFTVLPGRMVKLLDLKPDYEQAFSLADGTTIKRQIGSAYINFKGRRSASPVVLGKTTDSALMGVLSLEALGFILDPFNRKLHPIKLSI